MNNPILSVLNRSLGFREIELRGIYYYMEKGSCRREYGSQFRTAA